MSPNPTRKDIIQAIITNPTLDEEQKSLLVEEFIDEIKKEYPDLKNHATKSDVVNSELKLTKEIEKTRLEIKELDVKLTKEIEKIRLEIKELDVKLTKEIEKVRSEVKESKTETVKWVAGMLFVQVVAIAGLFFTAFKLFGQQ